MSGKCSQKLLDHAKQFVQNSFKNSNSKIVITGDLVGNEIADRNTKVSENS